MKQLLFLSLVSINIQGMDLIKYFSKPIQTSEDLNNAIERNDYNSIYYFCEQNKRIKHNPQEVKKLCLENIESARKTPFPAKDYALAGTGIAMSALAIHYLALVVVPSLSDDYSDLDREFFVGAMYGVITANGLNTLYRAITEGTNKQRYKNALAIKQLLIERDYFDIE